MCNPGLFSLKYCREISWDGKEIQKRERKREYETDSSAVNPIICIMFPFHPDWRSQLLKNKEKNPIK